MQPEDLLDDEVVFSMGFQVKRTRVAWKYTFGWFILSVFMIFALGFGLLMLLYTPFVFWLAYTDRKTRMLFVTADSVILTIKAPCCFPGCGFNTSEKYIGLSMITDVALTQDCIDHCWGIDVLRIENAGQSGGVAADLLLVGIDDARKARKVILAGIKISKSGQAFTTEHVADIFSKNSSHEIYMPPQPVHANLCAPAESAYSQALISTLDQLNQTMQRMEQLMKTYFVPPDSDQSANLLQV